MQEHILSSLTLHILDITHFLMPRSRTFFPLVENHHINRGRTWLPTTRNKTGQCRLVSDADAPPWGSESKGYWHADSIHNSRPECWIQKSGDEAVTAPTIARGDSFGSGQAMLCSYFTSCSLAFLRVPWTPSSLELVTSAFCTQQL